MILPACARRERPNSASRTLYERFFYEKSEERLVFMSCAEDIGGLYARY
jgi:hypothetical protein